METIKEGFSNALEKFKENIPLTVHHQGNNVIVGVKYGYVKKADNMYGRNTVLEFLDTLEQNTKLLDI